jgi:hypothetical protein
MRVEAESIEALEALLQEKGFVQPVSRKIRSEQFAHKRRLYLRILRTVGLGGLFTTIAVSIYFWIKNLGVGVATKAVIGAFVGAGALAPVAWLILHPADSIKVAHEKTAEPVQFVQERKPALPATAALPSPHYHFGFRPVDSESVPAQVKQKVGVSLINSIRQSKGSEYAGFPDGVTIENASFMVRTAVEKMDNSYLVMIKVIDLRNSSIVYVTRETANSEEELEIACQKLANALMSSVP